MSSALSGREHTLLHYAWIIIGVAAAVNVIGAGLRAAFGVFINPLVDMFGWSAGSVAFAYAVAFMVTAVFSPISGWMTDHIGARRSMMIGTAVFLAGMIGTSTVSHLWQLYLWYGLFLGVAQSLFLIPVMPAVSAWFRRHLGLGTGILWLSWGLGPVVGVQVMSVLIDSLGWQSAFRWAGIVATLLIVGLLALFRNSPAEAGRRPYGWRTGEPVASEDGHRQPARRRQYQRYIYGTTAFWNLINIHFLGCVGHAIILVMIVPMAIHRGLEPNLAAGVLSTLAGVSLLTRFVAPYLSDHVGSKPVMFLSFLGQSLTVILLLNAESTLAFYVFAVTFGIGYGGEGTVFPVIDRQYYGNAPIGPTYGWQILGANLGMALGGVLGAFTFDLTGAYTLAIWLSAGFSLAGAASIAVLEPTRRLLIPEWEHEPRSAVTASGVDRAPPTASGGH